ncbi:MAG: GNAT family N-acetyltransferase [bacterium]|nr:GNAT family N-acetyltransferase [bacterium]
MKYSLLETSRLILRKFEPNDLSFVYNHFSNSFVSEYLYDNEPPKNKDEAKEILDWCIDIESLNHIRWCIILKEKNIPIGTVGFHIYDQINNAIEIGYDLSQKYTQQGYMTEAMNVVINYGFKNYNLNRIHACVAVENTGSNRLLEKSGFHLEGIIRDKHFFRGNYYDHNLFSLLKKDKSNNF